MHSTCNGRNAQSLACIGAHDANLLQALYLISGWCELRCSGRASSSCSNSGTHRIAHVKYLAISHLRSGDLNITTLEHRCR